MTARLATLRSGAPDVMTSFGSLGRAAMANGVLSAKTKQLMALALGVAARCDPCIGYHVQALVKLGASRQELDETLADTTTTTSTAATGPANGYNSDATMGATRIRCRRPQRYSSPARRTQAVPAGAHRYRASDSTGMPLMKPACL